MSETSEKYEGWSILELMGHRRLGGFVKEQEIAGAAFLRIDIPNGDTCTGCGNARTQCEAWRGGGAVACCPDCSHAGTVITQFYPPSSVYCLTPVTEEMARAVAARNVPQPVARWELPAAPTPTQTVEYKYDESVCPDCGTSPCSDACANENPL